MKANSGSKPPSGKKDAKKAKEAASKDSNNSNLLSPKYELDDNEDWSYPKWANAPRVGFGDRFELLVFRFITWVPVIITFCIFGFLFGFYLFVSKFAFSITNHFLVLLITLPERRHEWNSWNTRLLG